MNNDSDNNSNIYMMQENYAQPSNSRRVDRCQNNEKKCCNVKYNFCEPEQCCIVKHTMCDPNDCEPLYVTSSERKIDIKATLNLCPQPCVQKPPYASLYLALYTIIANDAATYTSILSGNQFEQTIVDQASYTAFVTALLALANPILLSVGLGTIPPGLTTVTPRILIAESDGTVLLDTAEPINNLITPTARTNSYASWQAKVIDENHNTRVAVMTAQIFVGGVGYETKYSSTVGFIQNYVAIRANNFLNNQGTIRLSVNAAQLI